MTLKKLYTWTAANPHSHTHTLHAAARAHSLTLKHTHTCKHMVAPRRNSKQVVITATREIALWSMQAGASRSAVRAGSRAGRRGRCACGSWRA